MKLHCRALNCCNVAASSGPTNSNLEQIQYAKSGAFYIWR